MVQYDANHVLYSIFALINGRTWASVVLRTGRLHPAHVLNLYRDKYFYGITLLTLRLLMPHIYGAPSKARNANVVYIWTYVWQR